MRAPQNMGDKRLLEKKWPLPAGVLLPRGRREEQMERVGE